MELKLSLLTPTHNSASTIERTLSSMLAQRYRPLEIVVYDEASTDGTLDVVARVLENCNPNEVEIQVLSSRVNSGPVKAWRVPLWKASGSWCCFVWADDVLDPAFSERMMAGVGRAVDAGRVLVFSSAIVEIDGRAIEKYSTDQAVLTPAEFSLGIFLRRYSLSKINGVYETAAIREIFDRHIDMENPLGVDFGLRPYGNDVAMLSDLALKGGGVEILGDRLARLVLSSRSMTKSALSRHEWQFRWQYTFSFYRTWNSWAREGVEPAARALVEMARNRLALCEFLVPGGFRLLRAGHPFRALRSLAEFGRWDWERTHMPLDEYRRRVKALAA